MISKDFISKLILGTANFGQEYNGHTVPPDEQKRIWDYCRKVGIDTVDTAFAYGKINIPKDFKVITKIRPMDRIEKCYGCLVHHSQDFSKLWPYLVMEKGFKNVGKIGVSIYRTDELYPIFEKEKNSLDIIQIPYNMENKSAAELLWLKGKVELHFRSIFGGGKLIKNGVKKCLEFALDSIADKVVIGVDSLKHLKEIIE